VNIITALIGIFAIPQFIEMWAKGRVVHKITAVSVGKQSILTSVKLLFKNTKAITIGTITGSVIGLIPSVGGQIAGLLAYDQTRKMSADGDTFGKGNPAGVIAAESANNAMVGPSLVPLLTLSIPGSPTAAVLLGDLLIHGIFPGSDLFDNHPEVAWTFINSMLIGQVLMVIFGIWVASYAARVAQMSYR
jgi:putative tricarboxylic transport membrane protein